MAPRESGSDDGVCWQEKEKKKVSVLLVARRTQCAQTAQGQYLKTCAAEWHVISTY